MYDLAVGPYDVIFALCWDRDAPGSPSSLVQLSYESGVALSLESADTCLCQLSQAAAELSLQQAASCPSHSCARPAALLCTPMHTAADCPACTQGLWWEACGRCLE